MNRYDAMQIIMRRIREAESSISFYHLTPHQTFESEEFYEELSMEILDAIEEFVGGSSLDG